MRFRLCVNLNAHSNGKVKNTILKMQVDIRVCTLFVHMTSLIYYIKFIIINLYTQLLRTANKKGVLVFIYSCLFFIQVRCSISI